jgi:hypothetical protein
LGPWADLSVRAVKRKEEEEGLKMKNKVCFNVNLKIIPHVILKVQ